MALFWYFQAYHTYPQEGIVVSKWSEESESGAMIRVEVGNHTVKNWNDCISPFWENEETKILRLMASYPPLCDDFFEKKKKSKINNTNRVNFRIVILYVS